MKLRTQTKASNKKIVVKMHRMYFSLQKIKVRLAMIEARETSSIRDQLFVLCRS